MTHEFWEHQKTRLKDRFGERNFSREFSLLVAIELKSTPDALVLEMVNHMIGHRPSSKAPLLSDFREFRLTLEKRAFERTVDGAAKSIESPWSTGFRSYLEKEFPGCKSVKEAVEVRKLQIQLERATNPDYDPMSDPRWMGEYVKLEVK